MSLTTIECSTRNVEPTLLEGTRVLTIHVAGAGASGGTGPILCGFDRFQRDESGRSRGGFSVGGGHGGPNTHHRLCKACVTAAGDAPIHGLNHELFQHAALPLRDKHGDVWTLGEDGLMHTRETAPFSRDHVERKWGPLLPADPALTRRPLEVTVTVSTDDIRAVLAWVSGTRDETTTLANRRWIDAYDAAPDDDERERIWGHMPSSLQFCIHEVEAGRAEQLLAHLERSDGAGGAASTSGVSS